MHKVMIFGAASAIAAATARHFAKEGSAFFLIGRTKEKLETVEADLKARGASAVSIAVSDLNDLGRHEELLREGLRTLGGADVILIAHGILGDQKLAEKDPAETDLIFKTNFSSPASIASHAAPLLQNQRHGTLAVISSVAGDRGRQSNYVYGASKAALSTFLQGLRNRMASTGIRVLTLKPGLIRTPMTRHMKHTLLSASAERTGEASYRAILKGKDTAYVPGYWKWVMLIVRLIPEAVFKRLRF